MTLSSPSTSPPFSEIAHIVGLGQSNEQGAQALPAVSGVEFGFDALMFAPGVQTRTGWPGAAAPELRDASRFILAPLMNVAQGLWSGETPAIGMIAQLQQASWPGDAPHLGEARRAHFLYSFPHQGGKHLAELDWRDYEVLPANPLPGPGGYHATFVDDIRRAHEGATSAGLAYRVLAFHLTQGENEGLGSLLPGGALLRHGAFVAAYKADLAAAHARWDADARAITGQSGTIPLFISQVDNCWAGQAQAQLADEHPDVYLIGPIYYVPSALNSFWNGTERGHRAHLSADGQRWRGEQAGKVMARVLAARGSWTPLQPKSARRLSDTSVVVAFDVPDPPLVFETEWLPRTPGLGFEVILGTPDMPIAFARIVDVAITAATEITITLDPSTPVGPLADAYVNYGQVLTVAATSQPVAAVRAGLPYEHGAALEVVFEGDRRAEFAPLLVQGCFLLRQPSDGAATAPDPWAAWPDGSSASIVVRDMRLEEDRTILRGEARSLEHAIVPGRLCTSERDRPFGNLRDSDPTPSRFRHADATYGSRPGAPYPLHNFCIVFAMAIAR